MQKAAPRNHRRKLARVTKNAAKLKQVTVDHGDPFLSDETDLYNILTKEVIR